MVLSSRSVIWRGFFLAVALIFLVFIGGVEARSKVVANINPVQVPIFSANVSTAPTCGLNYTDITAGVMQRMMSSQNFSNGVISSSPRNVDDRRFVFKIYDPNVVLVKYFLYDVGADLLWDTNDDLVYFLTNTSPANYNLLGMTTDNGNIVKFYWVLHNLQNPGGFNIYSCILNSGICNSNLVSFIADPLFVTGIVPLERNGTLFLALEDSSNTLSGGTIASCSLTSSQTNCSNSFLFNPIYSYPDFSAVSSFKDHGFSIQDVAGGTTSLTPISFLSVYNLESSFPLGSLVDKRSTFSIPGLLFFFRSRPNNINLTEVSILDTSNNVTSVIYTDSSSIRPHLSSFFSSGLITVYSRSNQTSYSHFVRSGAFSEKELFNGPWAGPLYEPFSIQLDGKIVSLSRISVNNYRVYRTNCGA